MIVWITTLHLWAKRGLPFIIYHRPAFECHNNFASKKKVEWPRRPEFSPGFARWQLFRDAELMNDRKAESILLQNPFVLACPSAFEMRAFETAIKLKVLIASPMLRSRLILKFHFSSFQWNFIPGTLERTIVHRRLQTNCVTPTRNIVPKKAGHR